MGVVWKKGGMEYWVRKERMGSLHWEREVGMSGYKGLEVVGWEVGKEYLHLERKRGGG